VQVALLCVVAAGCAPAPVGSAAVTPEPTPILVSPTPPASPTAPAPTQTVGLRWERLSELADMAYAFDLVRGDDGWVAIGDGCRAGCEQTIWTSWFSADASSWSATPLPFAGDSGPEQLAWGGPGYVAMGSDRQGIGDSTDVKMDVWRSSDGVTWERTDADLELGRCRAGVGCPAANGLALAPSGAIVVGYAFYEDEPSTGPYVSEGGQRWELLEPSAFGVETLEVRDVQSTASEVFLVGRTCRTCPTGIWTSADGQLWTPAGELAATDVATASIATNGSRLVAALVTCQGNTGCGSEVWSSVNGGPWTQDLVRPDLDVTKVVTAGDAFVIVGLRGETYEALTSLDGSNWVTVHPGPPSDDDCGVTWLAGGPGTVILGDPDCSIWRGTID
jgi:hypothetical protein